MIHITRRTGTGIQDPDDIRITLPPVPIPLDTTRSDTAPRLPMIRRPMGPVKGAALKAMGREKVEAFKRALQEVRNEWSEE
jgi:hypothetical protein